MTSKGVAIYAGQVLTPFRSFSPGAVVIEGERIVDVGPVGEVSVPARAEVIQAQDKIVVPGFIDTHIHGWGGTRFGESTEGALAICRSIVKAGTTGLLPTLGAEPEFEGILAHIRAVRKAMEQGIGGAEILGIHMEGPYFSTEDIARGSQEVPYLRKPSVDELRRMVEASEGAIRKMSIAPELPGALEVIQERVRWGIVPSAGHSTATYEQVLMAVEAGLRCATHTFNGMIPFHHRRPGLLGAALTEDRVHAEMIGDGEHISAVAMKVLLRCKGVGKVHLVTDNTVWAGMPDGTYEDRGGRRIVKEQTKAYVVGGTLAGSVAPMNYDVKNVIESTGCTLADAVRMASWNPAWLIGVADRKGSLEIGKDADLVIIDGAVNVYCTMVKGHEVYRSDTFAR